MMAGTSTVSGKVSATGDGGFTLTLHNGERRRYEYPPDIDPRFVLGIGAVAEIHARTSYETDEHGARTVYTVWDIRKA
jgi:hypothetical protein